MIRSAASPPTPIGPLLLTVFNSILEVFLLCLAGYLLAWKGVLDKKTQKQINHLNVSLFTPALLFSKVAFFLSPEKLRELWVVPIFFVIVTATSMLTAFTLGWFFNLRRSQRNFAMAAAMFMNSNSLPIALMQSLVVSMPALRWTKDDNKNAMVGRALTYLVLYSTLGMVVRWSYGVRLLSQADEEVVEEQDPTLASYPSTTSPSAAQSIYEGHTNEHTPLLVDGVASTSTFVNEPEEGDFTTTASPSKSKPRSRAGTGVGHGVREVGHVAKPPVRPPRRRTTMTYYKSFPNSPTHEETPLPHSSSESSLGSYSGRETPDMAGSPFDAGSVLGVGSDIGDEDDPHVRRARAEEEEAEEEMVLPVHSPNPTNRQTTGDLSRSRSPHRRRSSTHHHHHSHTFVSRVHRRLTRLLLTIHNFMTAPLYAAVLSIIVACTRPIQHALETHVLSVKGALSAAGNCSIPLTLVVLGAYFYVPPAPTSTPTTGEDVGTGNGNGNGRLGTKKSTETLVGSMREGLKSGFIGLKKRMWKGRRQAIELPSDDEGEGGDGILFSAARERERERERAQRDRLGDSDSGRRRGKEEELAKGETRTVVIAVLSRMVITPLLIMPIIMLGAKFDWQRVFEDPVFVVANVLLVSSPPALTLAQITQAASGDAFERLISRTIFWSYCVLTPPATIFYVVLGLVVAKL